MNSKSQRTPLVKKKIRKEPKALWPGCQSRPVWSRWVSVADTTLAQAYAWLAVTRNYTLGDPFHRQNTPLIQSHNYLPVTLKMPLQQQSSSQETVKPGHSQEKGENWIIQDMKWKPNYTEDRSVFRESVLCHIKWCWWFNCKIEFMYSNWFGVTPVNQTD